jgi:hypothetical protein
MQVEEEKRGFDVETSYHGSNVTVVLDIWADLNGDGIRSSGDAMGRVGPVALHDHGLCRGNLTRSDDAVLSLIP